MSQGSAVESLTDRRKRIEAETAARIAELLKERNIIMARIVADQSRNAEIATELKDLGYVHKRGPREPKATE
jgi:hypothetical protein